MMVVARMQKQSPGMTKEQAAKKLGVNRRSVDTKLLKLLVDLLLEKNVRI